MRVNVVETNDIANLWNQADSLPKKTIELDDLGTLINDLPKDSMLRVTFDAEETE